MYRYMYRKVDESRCEKLNIFILWLKKEQIIKNQFRFKRELVKIFKNKMMNKKTSQIFIKARN